MNLALICIQLNVVLISRLRLDAQLYEFPVFEKKKLGRMPLKGKRIELKELLYDSKQVCLRMNEDKTKLVKFSRQQLRQGIKQETFDFLGFTFYLGKSRKGYCLEKLKTIGKRRSLKLKKTNDWARSIRNKISMKHIMKTAAAKLSGHIQYYGVSHNAKAVDKFVYEVKRILFKWLNRRSQRRSFSWEQFQKYLDSIKFPQAKIYHKLF